MIRDATFSKDGLRRFTLIRDWRDEIGAPDKTVLFGMLNPSKAGKKEDDPTVRKSVGFARRWGFGRLVIVNLTPWVSTDPWGLPPWSGIDMENREATKAWMLEADMVVAAWGSVAPAIRRTIDIFELVHEFLEWAPRTLYSIGETKRGDPLHPSRAPYTASPVVWRSQ